MQQGNYATADTYVHDEQICLRVCMQTTTWIEHPFPNRLVVNTRAVRV